LLGKGSRSFVFFPCIAVVCHLIKGNRISFFASLALLS